MCLGALVGEQLREHSCMQADTCVLHMAISSGPLVATKELVRLTNPRSAQASTSEMGTNQFLLLLN